MSTSNSKLKLAIVSYVVLDNTYSGQKKRIFDLVHGLSDQFELHYIEISDSPKSGLVKKLEDNGVTYRQLNLNYTNAVRILITLLHAITFPFLGLKKSVFVGKWGAFANRKSIQTWDYDIVISEYFMSSFFFKYVDGSTLKVIDMHDIQYITLQEQLKSSKNIFRKFQLHFAKWFELKCLASADALMAVNLDEISYLQKKLSSNYIFTPLTIKDRNFVKSKSLKRKDSINLAYFAGLSSPRSYYEIKYLLENILPSLVNEYRDKVLLHIIGSSPSGALLQLIEEHENVVLVGEVADIELAFKDIDYGVNYWMGSPYGFRTRVLDVLATGTPIFLNRSCVAGMGLDDRSGLFFYEEASQIITTIDSYRNNEVSYSNLSAACAATANEFRSEKVYGKLYDELEKIYKQMYLKGKI